MYKLVKFSFPLTQSSFVERLADNAFIPLYDPTNTDYANFKKEINAETVELQDVEGNTMTAAEAKAYVATLP